MTDRAGGSTAGDESGIIRRRRMQSVDLWRDEVYGRFRYLAFPLFLPYGIDLISDRSPSHLIMAYGC
ncbi:uncharacterized [Tachysurus ichikawai]